MEGVAAERTLRFLVQIDAHLSDAERDIDRLRLMLESIERLGAVAEIDVAILEALAKIREVQERLEEIERTYTAILDINNRRALDKIRYFLARLDQINETTAEATLGANGEPVERTLQKIYVTFKNYERSRPTTTLGIDEQKAVADLKGFEAILSRYNNRWGGRSGIRARITADISQALANIKILNRMLESVEDEDHRARVEVEITKAMSELETLRQFADAVGAQDPTLSVSVKGVAIATAEMLGLQALADKLDGTNVNLKLDVDDRLSTAIPNILGAFEMQVRQLQSVMTTIEAVAFPVMTTFFASMPGLVTAAAGAVGSLATAVAPGLAGAFGLASGAMVIAMGSLYAFGTALRSVGTYSWNLSETLREQAFMTDAAKDAVTLAEAALKNAIPGTEEYRQKSMALTLAQQQYATEQAKVAAVMESVTPRLLALNKEFGEFEVTMIRVRAAMAHAAAPAVFAWLDMMNTQMPRIQPHFNAMVGEMAGVVVETIRMNQQGQRLRQWQTILMGIRNSGASVMEIFAGIFGLLRSFMAVIIPDSALLVQNIADLVTQAERWASSAQGQRSIGQAWAYMVQVAGQLWRISGNLARGIWGVISALNASGTGQWLLAQIERGSAAFAHMMRESGNARQAITDFVSSTRPLLASIGGFIGALVDGFLELANMASQADDQGQRWGTLIGIFEALERLVPRVVAFLRHEFERIGPLLPGLIENIGIWVTTFAKATPEMIVFIDTLTKALEAFNSLPEPVRIMIARTLAWAAAIKVLGGGALIGLVSSIGGAVVQFLMYRDIMGALGGKTKAAGGIMLWLRGIFDTVALRALYLWDAIKAGAARIGPALMRIGPWILRILAWFGRLALVRGIIMGVVAIFTALAGLITAPVLAAVAVITGLIAVGYLVYRNWSKLRNLLGRVFQSLPASVQGPLRIMGNALRLFGNVIRAIFTGNWKPAIDSARRYWNSLPQGVRAAARVVWGILRTAGQVLRGIFTGNWKPAIESAKRLFDTLPPGVRQRISRIAPILRMAGRLAMQIFRGDWGGAVRTLLSLISTISPGTRQRIAKIAPILRQAGSLAKAIFRSDWSQVVKILWGFLNQIAPGVTQRIARVAPILRAAGNLAKAIFRGDWSQVIQIAFSLLSRLAPGVARELSLTVGKIRAFGSQLYQLGRDAIQGLINGITSMAGAAASAVGGLLKSAYEAGKAAIGAKSPSRLFEQGLGVTIPQGIAGGILRGGSEAVSRIQQLMSSIFGEAGRRNPDDLMKGGGRGFRQQASQMQNLMKMHRAMQSSSMRMAQAMQRSSMSSVQAMRMMEQQMQRVAFLQGQLQRGGGVGAPGIPRPGAAGAAERPFRATPPRGEEPRRSRQGEKDQDRIDVYVHTDGPGAQFIDDDELADKLSGRLQRRRRRN